MAARKKQGELPGMEKKRIEELETVMEQLAEKSSELSKLRNEVGALKTKALELANKHKVTVYRDDTASPPLVLTVTPREETIKVTKVGAVDGADDSDEE